MGETTRTGTGTRMEMGTRMERMGEGREILETHKVVVEVR